jgi:hypothetical protein
MCDMSGGGHGHGPHGGHGHGFGGGHGSGCCTPHHGMGHHGGCQGGGWRRFISPAEQLECLHKYLEELKKEMAGVEARIHDLKGK